MAFKFICCVLSTLCVPLFAQVQPPSKRQLIQDVRVFDGKVVSQHRSVLIENGKIGRIYTHPVRLSDTEIIDGAGRTLLPGLIDAHPESRKPTSISDAAVLPRIPQRCPYNACWRCSRPKHSIAVPSAIR